MQVHLFENKEYLNDFNKVGTFLNHVNIDVRTHMHADLPCLTSQSIKQERDAKGSDQGSTCLRTLPSIVGQGWPGVSELHLECSLLIKN